MEKHLERIIKLSNFSSLDLYSRCHEDSVTESVKERGLDFTLRIETLRNYLNNECLGFRIRMEFSKYELFGVHLEASVIDVGGNKRYLRPFNEPVNSEIQFSRRFVFIEVEDYVSLETLRSHSSELLPDDCLTVQYDVFCTFDSNTETTVSNWNDHSNIEKIVSSSFEINPNPKVEKCMLDLHSEMAKFLFAESIVFQDMFYFTRTDDNEKYLECILRNEVYTFAKIYMIIINREDVKNLSLIDFCDVCYLADKYDIPAVVKASRKYIESLSDIAKDSLISMHIYELQDELTVIAEKIKDDRLKKIIEESQENKPETYTVMSEQYTELKREMQKLEKMSPFEFMRLRGVRPDYDFYS